MRSSRKLWLGCAGAAATTVTAASSQLGRHPPCWLSSVRADSTLSSSSKPSEYRPLIILGSGPAGLTAALYTARANLNPLVLEGEQSGGQLTTTTEVENYPGFRDGIDGNELIDSMKAQSERFGSEFRFESVDSVDFSRSDSDSSSSRLRLKTHKREYECDAVIVATGASAMYLGLPNELALIGHGVSACATCDGFFFRGKHVCGIPNLLSLSLSHSHSLCFTHCFLFVCFEW